MLNALFWIVTVLVWLSLITLPALAHTWQRVRPIDAAVAVGVFVLEVGVSIALFAQQAIPSTLLWAALIFMVAGCTIGLMRMFLNIGRSIYYSNAFMAFLALDAIATTAALFVLRG